MKLKVHLPARRFFAFWGILYAFCAAVPLLFAAGDTAQSERVFRIYDTGTQTTYTVCDLDFLCGALPLVSNISAPDEALKAEIIALHTLYDRRRRENAENEYDFTCDSTNGEVFSAETALSDEEKNRVRALCLSVSDKEIYAENEPIEALSFAVSAGCTRPYGDVFADGEYPYLIAVPCPSDLLAPDFKETAVFSKEDIQNAFPEILFDGAPGDWVSDITYDAEGYVQTLSLCGTTLSGVQVQAALSLCSASFSVHFADGEFSFTTRGSGHGVGMSRAAAAAMAEDGASYEEILQRFYPGTEIKACRQ